MKRLLSLLVAICVSSAAVAAAGVRTSGTNMGYTMQGGAYTALNLADGTTYYIGWSTLLPTGTHVTYANVEMTVPKAGTVRRIHMRVTASGAGSTESVGHYLRVNDNTDVTLSTTETYDISASKEFNYTNLSTAVNQGDHLALKVVCPAWATNPSAVTYDFMIYIE